MLHYSMAIASTISGILSIVLLWMLLSIYRRAMNETERALAGGDAS